MSTYTIRSCLKLGTTLLLALLALAGCTVLPAGRARSGPGEEPTPTPIPTPIGVSKPTYAVARGEVTRQLILGGRIVPVTQKDLFFKTSGRVRAVFVKTGDHVKAGQLLADLEMENVERDLAGSQLDLERAQARLKAAEAELQENIKRAQANLDIARENLAIIIAQDPTPRKVKAEAALQSADLARKQAEGAAIQQANLNYMEAQAAYDLVLQDMAVHSHQVTIARLQVDLAQVALDSLNQGVDPLLVNDVKRAQFAVDKLQAAVADAQIVAPFDGQVQLAFILTEGAAIDAFQYVVTVSDPMALEVSADTVNVPLDQLSVGIPVTVSLVTRPGQELKAHIRRLPAFGQFAGSSQDKSLHIALDDSSAQAGYGWGDLIRITVVLEQKQDVLWLPPAAIRTFEGRKFVVVQEGTGQRRADIKVGIEGQDRVEIVSGLTEGQIIVGQ